MNIKDKLVNAWLWAVAIVITIVMAFTAMAWVGGMALIVVRWLNG